MKNENHNIGTGSGLQDISQMGMTGEPSVGQRSGSKALDLGKYGKPALFAIAGILALALLFVIVKGLSGGKYSQKDYEEAAMYMMAMPVSEKELEQWKKDLKNCYPPEAEKVLDEVYSAAEDVVELLELMEEEDEESYEWTKEMLTGFKVSGSRMLDGEECEECEELIEKNFGITIKVDAGYLVEMEMDPKVVAKLEDEMGEGMGSAGSGGGVVLVLRSGKYIGPWASTGGLELNEVKNLRRDLDW